MDRGDSDILAIEELTIKLVGIRNNMETITKDNVELYIFKFGERIKTMLYNFIDKADSIVEKMDKLQDQFLGDKRNYYLIQDITYFQANKVKFDKMVVDFKQMIDEQFKVLLNLENMRIQILSLDVLNKKIEDLQTKNENLEDKIEQIIMVFKSIADRTTNLEISFEEFGTNIKKIVDEIYDTTVTHEDLDDIKTKIGVIDSKTALIPRMIIK